MNATLPRLALALLATMLAIAPIAAADDGGEASGSTAAPCEWFQYWLDPPSYELRPECISGPVLDNLP